MARASWSLVESHDGNAYRAVYTVRFEEAVYVLHAFQKKTQVTAKRDLARAEARLKELIRSGP